MVHPANVALVLIGELLAMSPGAGPAAGCPDPSTVVHDVTAYVGDALERREHVDIVIRAGLIAGVRPTEAGKPDDPCTRVIDGNGLFATPGLFDLHVHVSKAGPEFLWQLPAIGLTSVRDMGSSLEEINELRRRGSPGTGMPHISSPGAMFESRDTIAKLAGERTLEPWPLTREGIGDQATVEEAIADHKQDGANFIKIRSAADATEFRRVAAAAAAVGLPVASHPPPGIGPLELDGLGIVSIEHGSYPYPIVGGDLPVDAVAQAFMAQSITLVPTIVAWKSQVAGVAEVGTAVEETLEDTRLAGFIPPRLAVEWSFDLSRRKPRSTESQQGWNGFYRQLVDDLRALQVRGVRIAAGSDTGVESVVPGIALLRELCTLEAEVGVPALELLRANTSHAARLAGLDAVTGRIEVGLSADLVLWSRDPAASIRLAVPAMHTTFLRGRPFAPPHALGALVGRPCGEQGKTDAAAP